MSIHDIKKNDFHQRVFIKKVQISQKGRIQEK